MQSRGQRQLKSSYSNLFLLSCQPQTSEVLVLRCCWQTEPSPLSVLHGTVCAWVNMTWLLYQSGISSHTTAGIKVNLAKSDWSSSENFTYRLLTIKRMQRFLFLNKERWLSLELKHWLINKSDDRKLNSNYYHISCISLSYMTEYFGVLDCKTRKLKNITLGCVKLK